jgi:hypothetical protein
VSNCTSDAARHSKDGTKESFVQSNLWDVLHKGNYQYNDGKFFLFLTCLTAVSLDLTLSPLYRTHGQESPILPGLLALVPPRKAARGREQDRLVVYLYLTGTATFSAAEYTQLASDAGALFHRTPGPLTSALRAAANAINQALLERNQSTSGRGQYAAGWLTLMALRETQCTFLLSGPMHAFVLGQGARHIFEPELSGKGLGINQAAPHYFTQINLAANDRILLAGRVPSAWDSTLAGVTTSSLEAIRRRLLTLTTEDLHSVLIQATTGAGDLHLMTRAAEPAVEIPREAPAPVFAPTPAPAESLPPLEEPDSTPEPDPYYPAHVLGPSAYAIPPQTETTAPVPPPRPFRADDFPASIPRARPKEEPLVVDPDIQAESIPEPILPEATPHVRTRRRLAVPRETSPFTRSFAKSILNGIEAWRRWVRSTDEATRKFLPRLLPGNEAGESKPLPDATLFFLAVLIPVIVATIGLVMFLGSGRSSQYENYFAQARTARDQAVSLTDPLMSRDAWNEVLIKVDMAEGYRKTDETRTLRVEANQQLDQLMGVLRLNFQPAFTSKLNIKISRLAATESDLYLLDAEKGEVLRAQYITTRGFQIDTTFNCKPGEYSGYQVGPLVDILALPLYNLANAAVLGVDAAGNLLYCAPNQVPMSRPLQTSNTNWGRITSFTMDGGNLYVLDAPSRAVWVYTGKDSEFVDPPYFFFSNQVPEIQNGIDLVVKDDELYVLHSDGHLTTCAYSRITMRPTTCQEPALVNPFPAMKDTDLFTQANITQMIYSSPPDSTLLLLGADNQVVLRFSPTSFELQNQFRPTSGSLPAGFIGAMTTSPNHVLYLAVGDQVYFSNEMP